MADLNAKILPLYTETAGREPDDLTMLSLGKDALEVGEIAVNLLDRKIFSKRSDGSVVTLGSGADSGSGSSVLSIAELVDVDATLRNALATDFESNEAFSSTYISTAQSYNGTQSWYSTQNSSTETLSGVYAGTNRYTVYCARHFLDGAVSTESIFESKETSNQGLIINRYNSAFEFTADGVASLTGTWPSITSNTWGQWLVQIDWGSEEDRTETPEVSVWFEGVQYVDRYKTLAVGIVGKNTDRLTIRSQQNKYIDNLTTYEWHSPLVPMDEASFTPSDIDAIIRDTPVSDGQVLAWNDSNYNFELSTPDIRYTIKSLDDYSGETRLPHDLIYDEDLAVTPGLYLTNSTQLQFHDVDKSGIDQYEALNALPTTGILYTSADGITYAANPYTSKVYSAIDKRWIFTFDIANIPTATGTVYISLSGRVSQEQTPRVGELLKWDGAKFTPAALADDLAYNLQSLLDVSDTAPTDGQVLSWDATAGNWSPVDMSGGSGAVSSVNGAVGVVSLGIQDLNDFELEVDPLTSLDIPLASGDVLQWNDVDQKFKPAQSSSSVGALDDLSDVDTTTNAPQEGNTLVYDAASGQWKPYGISNGWLTTRADEVEVTASVDDQVATDLLFDGLGQVGEFVQITVSEPAWVRFYPTAADRTADGARASDEDPDPGAGVLLEALTTTSNEVVKVTPGASYYNNDTPSEEKLFCRVTNLSGVTQAITVTVRAFKQVDFSGFTGGTFGSG